MNSVFDSLADVGWKSDILGAELAHTAKNTEFELWIGAGGEVVCLFTVIDIGNGLRNIHFPLITSREHHLTYIRRAGKVVASHKRIVSGAYTLYRHRNHVWTELVHCLKIFNAKGVVRLLENVKKTVAADCFKSLRTCRGKAKAVFKIFFQTFGYCFAVDCVLTLYKLVNVAAFAAEAEHIHAAEAVEQWDSAVGKALSKGCAPKRRQFYNEIDAVFDSHFRSRPFWDESRFTSLNIVRAHNGDDMCPFAELLAFFDLISMTVVEGVVFRDDPCDFHEIPP